MHTFYFENINQDIVYFSDEEAKHCLKVLRLRLGDKIWLTNGKGFRYEAEIISDNLKSCTVKILSQIEFKRPEYQLHIAIAPPKNPDRLEWFFEKAVEIGIEEIIILYTKRTERFKISLERLNRIGISAIKQCQGYFLPKLCESTFPELIKNSINFVGQKMIPHCEVEHKIQIMEAFEKNQNALILIGPEGDFTPSEIEIAKNNGFIPIALGNQRLRTETAALYATVAYKAYHQFF